MDIAFTLPQVDLPFLLRSVAMLLVFASVLLGTGEKLTSARFGVYVAALMLWLVA